ncbi:MAG: hypothetical protein KME14_24620 [Tildeniella torsiva UHER 1998/13D]|nr:hypothetical protein [Tildeniella torsiva UHER 1998/13D]
MTLLGQGHHASDRGTADTVVANGETNRQGLAIDSATAAQGDQIAVLVANGERSRGISRACTGQLDLGFTRTAADQLPLPPLQVAIRQAQRNFNLLIGAAGHGDERHGLTGATANG